MNALFTKEQIFERITDSGYPFWTLWLISGFQNKSHVMTYWGNDFNEIESDETKIQKSIAKLESVINSCPPDSMFSIEIKNAKTANGIGILGPFQFSSNSTAQPQNNVSTVAGLSGLPQISESLLDGIKKQMQDSFDLKLEHFKNECFIREKEQELKRREDDLKERLKECAELKKGYDSGVARTADVLLLAGTRFLKILLPNLIPESGAVLGGVNGAKEPQPQMQSQPQPEPEPEPDPKSDEVNEVAEFIYNNFSIQEIKDFKNKLKNAKSNLSNPQAETDTDTDTEYEDEDGI